MAGIEGSEAGDRRRSVIALGFLTAVYVLNYADRYLASNLLEAIKADFALSDAQVGALTGTAVAILFVTASIPIGILADRWSRRNIIVAALGIWSVATVACGLARTVPQFFVARMIVGVGEAGGTPASFALLADFFRPGRRTVATTIFVIGASVGGMLGSLGGGMIAENHGWRAAFIVFGAAGLPLALATMIAVREPRRGRFDEVVDSGPDESRSTLAETCRYTLTSKPLFHAIMGGSVMSLWGWGLLWWAPSYLMRVRSFSLEGAGQALGLMHGIGGTATLLAIAGLAMLLRQQTMLRLLNLSIVGGLASIFAVLIVRSDTIVIAGLSIFVILLYVYTGPTAALIQDFTPAHMRSQVFAIFTVLGNVTNLVFAPMLIGALSDSFQHFGSTPAESLRLALLIWAWTGFWALFHYLRVSALSRMT